jgi:hypothetical protein
MAAKWTTASGGRGGWPSSKPAKDGWVVSALNAWPLSVRSAMRVGTRVFVERLQIDVEDGIAVRDQMRNGVPAGLAGSAGEHNALAGHENLEVVESQP